MDSVLSEIKRGGEMVGAEKNLSLQTGDWVEIGNGYIPGNPKIKGYVVTVDKPLERALVQATWNSWGKNNHKGWIPFKHLTKLQQETDPNILIDLALATRDEKWFTQLTRGME